MEWTKIRCVDIWQTDVEADLLGSIFHLATNEYHWKVTDATNNEIAQGNASTLNEAMAASTCAMEG